MDPGEALFAESHAFGAAVRRWPLPCCTMTALWVALVEGVKVDLSGSMTQAATSARRSSSTWATRWQDLNVVDGRQPWSPLSTAWGQVQAPRLVSTSTPAPYLTPGRWHLIQRWRGLSSDGRVVAGSQGHAYLVRADGAGRGCTVYQSSEAKGFRVSAGTWDGTAGLTGWMVGSVTLPAMGDV
ncbi:MAG: hypothetical protein ACO3UW_08490 [Candidatus Nanopelagicales bacterium]